MAAECSFDIVSQFDEQELVNAIDQTRREVHTRFDLKNTKTDIAHSKEAITIVRKKTNKRVRPAVAGPTEILKAVRILYSDSNAGTVAGWITHERASGIVVAENSADGFTVTGRSDTATPWASVAPMIWLPFTPAPAIARLNACG